MRIVYGYSNCTDALYHKIVSERNVSVLRPDQKYHGLLIKGLAKNGIEVRCISGLPINRAVTARKLIREKDERDGSAYFHYITTLNFPLVRQLMILFGTFFSVLRVKKDKDTYAICDCLNIANVYGMTLACRLRKIPIALIVTDLPDMEHGNAFLKKLNNKIFKKSDGFIILTEQMNKRVNLTDKPYIVLEGHVDSEIPPLQKDATYETKTGKKIIMYAGSLKKIYGISNLVEGFIRADIPESELWIYGDGDFREDLEELSAVHENVRFMGIKSNREIVDQERKVSLLVNPRPVAPEYTKYSFPSKNMEYMASGTPTLTTRLPGMPHEYYPYVYLIEDETPEGIAHLLKTIFAEPLSERTAKAKKAREYVLEHKSNIVQASKIIKFLETEL